MTPARAASSTDRQSFIRPVPRRRADALLLKPIDLAWMVALAILSCGLALAAFLSSHIAPGPALPFVPSALDLPIGGAALAITGVGVYLIGLRIKDRGTAIIAGLLVAASLALATGASASPLASALAALAVFSLFCAAMGWSIAALILAGIAAFGHADLLLLGSIIAVVSLAQRRRHAWPAAVVFLALAGGACGMWLGPKHYEIGLWLGSEGANLSTLAVAGAALLPVAWFLFPYLSEWSLPSDRAKWWAPAGWVALSLILALARRSATSSETLLPALPVVYLMTAAGISRLLPAFAGEFVRPATRYLVAIGAVGTLLAARGVVEWAALHGSLFSFLASLPK